MTQVAVDFLGVALLLASGWLLHKRTAEVYAALQKIGGLGAFPLEGAKRRRYERFLRTVGLVFLCCAFLGILVTINAILEGSGK